jgi:hypothetical protein
VINTCPFIDLARKESIEAILEAHQQRVLNKTSKSRIDRERLHVAKIRE